jgi:hypothetical protein
MAGSGVDAGLVQVRSIQRGIVGLVHETCDDVPFIRRIHAAARISDGEDPRAVARSLHMSLAGARAAFENAQRSGVAGLAKLGDRPRPAFDMAVTLFVGRLTEAVFERRYRSLIESWGYTWKDMRGRRSEVDFSIELDDQPVLDINTKNASTQYRNAAQLGLDPSKIVPLGVYKLLAGRKSRDAREVPFVFAYLVDWGLSAKAQEAGRRALSEEELQAFALVLNLDKEPKKRKVEDAAVDAMFERSKADLIAMADRDDEFEVVGLARAMNIFLENFETRAPALRNTRGWQGQIGYFIKLGDEMTPWPTLLEMLRRKETAELARRVRDAEI